MFEGYREINLALDSKVKIVELYVCKQLLKEGANKVIDKALAKKVSICEVNAKVYEKIAYGNRQDGIVAVAKQPIYKLSDIKLTKNPLLVAACQVEKPGNLGAMLRTIDAAGIDGLIVADPVAVVVADAAVAN